MNQLFKGITDLTRKFIRSPVLLFGSMAIFALLKLLTSPPRRPRIERGRSPGDQDPGPR